MGLFMLHKTASAPTMAQHRSCAAEDRILGFEIVAKRDAQWRLHYDALAQAATDVPDTVGKLVRQRRRWLNGSFFATIYAVSMWGRLMRGNQHSAQRRLLFAVLFTWYVAAVPLAALLRILLLGIHRY
jgi:chitin synthase